MAATRHEVAEPQMTVDEFIALPVDDGVDRMLIQGRLLEKPRTLSDRWHSSCKAAIAGLVGNWGKLRPNPRGTVYSGGGFLLRRSPSTVVEIDIAYAACEIDSSANFIEATPVLAVEILAPKDKQSEVIAKVREYLDVGVELVWIVEPIFQTVTVYRQNEGPKMFSGADALSGDDHLPGFQINVNQIFED